MRSRRSGRALLACATSLARRRSRMSPASMQAPAPRTTHQFTHRVAEFLGGPLTFVARTGNCRRVAVADACRCRAVCRVHSQSTFSFSEHTSHKFAKASTLSSHLTHVHKYRGFPQAHKRQSHSLLVQKHRGSRDSPEPGTISPPYTLAAPR